MGFWETVLQIIPLVWDTVSQHFGQLRDLNDNISTLMAETNELKRKRDEFEEDVKAAESIGKKKLRVVDTWFNDVDKLVPEVNSIELEFNQGIMNPLLRHKFGKRVVKKIKDVKVLQEKWAFDEVAKSPRQQPVREVPEQLQQQSTSQETLEKITQALSDEGVGSVCIYGMGGIGKTTLMKAIYNKFVQDGHFDQVIWVTVSKDLNLHVIQEKIGNKIEVDFHGSEGIEEKRDKLYARLNNLRYMLILDDLWKAFPLDQVGIPQPKKQNRCKIAVTTRLIAVGNVMEVDTKIKVKALTGEEAWNLFYSRAGNFILLPEIRPLAKMVVAECGGLPLAIKTVGGAMRHKGKKELWEDALRALRAPAVPEVPGMEYEVFLPLKLSYDYLEDPKIQLCFFYCSLYPEDYEISTRKLVRYWAFEEGLIDNVNSLDQALKKGQSVLERLKDASLLEVSEDNQSVRMHDVLRDLAIWISSSSPSCFPSSKFLVKAGEGLEEPPEETMWEGLGRISFMRNQIRELQMMPKCPDLVSLFLHKNHQLCAIHDNFFHLMPKLQILDLSHTRVKSLPLSLSLLVNLRVLIANSCRNLQEMPPLGNLKELRLLDLCATGIENLPQGIASLAKLRYLDLSHTNALATVPQNMISGLTCLEDLRLLGRTQIGVNTWRDLATLQRLTSLQIHLPNLDAFMAQDMSHSIWSRLMNFHVQFGFIGKTYNYFEKIMSICDCQEFSSQIKSLVGNAESLIIKQCQGLQSLSQIICDSNSLKGIELLEIQGMKCVIDWREVRENAAFGSMEELVLRTLPSLQKLFDGGPTKGFQKLRRISIYCCPKLTSILSSGMIQHLHQLEMLSVKGCGAVEEIVESCPLPLPDVMLPQLSYLYLKNLPKLMTICSEQLPLTSMKYFEVADCPELRKLPILCPCIHEIRGRIEADEKWWEKIHWEDEHSKFVYSAINKRRDNRGMLC